MRRVSLPCFLGPLKKVSGEEAGIGACSGNLTIAEPKPLPMIAPPHALRDAGTSVATSLPCVQTSRPLVSTAPCLSNSKLSSPRIGGSYQKPLEIVPQQEIVIGAFLFFGSVSGLKPP